MNYHILDFILQYHSPVVGLNHVINPPESSSSHHPDEQGETKRLEKSAADLKGLGKVCKKLGRSESSLLETSSFSAVFHSRMLLTMGITPRFVLG